MFGERVSLSPTRPSSRLIRCQSFSACYPLFLCEFNEKGGMSKSYRVLLRSLSGLHQVSSTRSHCSVGRSVVHLLFFFLPVVNTLETGERQQQWHIVSSLCILPPPLVCSI